MVMSEIQAKIDYYNGLANDCCGQIEDINQKIEKASAVSSGLEEYLRNINEDIEQRKGKLNVFGCDTVRSSILGRYFEGMKTLLTGNEYQQNYYNLDQGLQNINNTINDLGEELVRLSGQRDDAWSNKSYWEQQMPYAEDYPA